MVVERTHALISYNNSKDAPQQERDYRIALRLIDVLRQNGIEAEVKGYSDSESVLSADTQWLILIHSTEIGRSSQIADVVNGALERVVDRRMRGVLAITTTPFDLRPEWASIRTYDASDPAEESVALSGISRATQYAKAPYRQSQERPRSQLFRARFFGRREISVVWQIVAVVLTIVLFLGIVTGGVILRTNSLTASTDMTATAQSQSHVRATRTAIAATASISSTPDTKTVQARQKVLDDLTKTPPTIAGFRTTEQWSAASVTDTTSCSFGTNNNYVVESKITGQYVPCIAKTSAFTNYVLQVTMAINGDAGGVILNSDATAATYYRLSVNQSNQATPAVDTFSMYLCREDCATNSINLGTSIATATGQVDRTKPLALTVIVQSKSFDLYINGKYLARFTDTISTTMPQKGPIGVYAASPVANTTVTFSSLKVWSLDK